jgi:hypothetical protein
MFTASPAEEVVHDPHAETVVVYVTGPSDNPSPTANPVPSVRMARRPKGTMRRLTRGGYAERGPLWLVLTAATARAGG